MNTSDIYFELEGSQVRRSAGISDDALALKFIDEHGGELRYVSAFGGWMVWN